MPAQKRPLSDKAKLAHYQAQIQLNRLKEQEAFRKQELANQKKAIKQANAGRLKKSKEKARIEKAGGIQYVTAKKKHVKYVHKKQIAKWEYERNPIRNAVKSGRSFWKGNKL